jgi:hypothetical protein
LRSADDDVRFAAVDDTLNVLDVWVVRQECALIVASLVAAINSVHRVQLPAHTNVQYGDPITACHCGSGYSVRLCWRH